MSRRDYQIRMDEANPGMVLSDDLLNADGKTLLPAGALLTDANLLSLRRRGVETLMIRGEETSDSDNAAELHKHRQRLARLFRKHTEDDMATEVLRQFVANFRLGAHP